MTHIRTGSRKLKVLVLESFWGGSHRAAAEGWAGVSEHEVVIECLPARFWKWRMRGAAFEFAKRLRGRLEKEEVDVVFATDMLDVAHLKAFLVRPIGTILYFHENQASYPPVPEETTPERDLQYVFTNLASALASDYVAFNSDFQRARFWAGMEEVLRRMPDFQPLWCLDELGLREKTVRLRPLRVHW